MAVQATIGPGERLQVVLDTVGVTPGTQAQLVQFRSGAGPGACVYFNHQSAVGATAFCETSNDHTDTSGWVGAPVKSTNGTASASSNTSDKVETLAGKIDVLRLRLSAITSGQVNVTIVT